MPQRLETRTSSGTVHSIPSISRRVFERPRTRARTWTRIRARVRTRHLQPAANPVRLEAAPICDLHHILIAHEVIGVLRYRRQSAVRSSRSSLGSREISLLQDPIKPELEEGPRGSNRRSQRLWVLQGKLSGIAARRELGDNYVNLVAALPLVDPSRRRLACAVGVVSKNDALSEVPQQLEMLFGQRRATGGYRTGEPGLKTPDDVCVPFAHHYLSGGDDVFLRPVQRVESAPLRVDDRLLAVLVLGFCGPLSIWRRFTFGKDPSPQGNRMTRRVADRKDDAPPESVLAPPPAVDKTKPCPTQHPLGQLEGATQGVPIVRSPSETELASNGAVVPPGSQVVPSRAGVR